MEAKELDEILFHSNGKLTDWQCRCLVFYMMGYLRHASDIELTRTEFYTQIKAGTAGKPLPYLERIN